MGKKLLLILTVLVIMAAGIWAQDIALKGGTILTITNGTIENGTIVIQKGKIAAIGTDIPIPDGTRVVDVTGKFIMPGVIDSHSHIALTDVNEATDPVTPQIWMWEALDPGWECQCDRRRECLDQAEIRSTD
jgi:imidazolonepropionase-like amidohydrolase